MAFSTWRQLGAGLDDRGHVDLVLEVRRRDAHGLGDSRQGVGLVEVAGQRLLDDDAFDPRPVLDGRRDLAHHVHADEIRGEDADHVDRIDQLGDGAVDLRVAQVILPGPLGQGLGALESVDARQFRVADGPQGPLVEGRDKARSDHPNLQHRQILSRKNRSGRRVEAGDACGLRPVTNRVPI